MPETRTVTDQAERYLLDLATKRDAAFRERVDDAYTRTAITAWGQSPPAPPHEREKLALCVFIVCGSVVVGLLWAALRWRAGVAW